MNYERCCICNTCVFLYYATNAVLKETDTSYLLTLSPALRLFHLTSMKFHAGSLRSKLFRNRVLPPLYTLYE